MMMFRLLKRLDDDFTVRHLLDAEEGPQFLVTWRRCHAFLIRVASTSQELAETALSPTFLPDAESFSLDGMDQAKTFGVVDPGIPVRRLVVFPNVDNVTIDQIERFTMEVTGVSFLGLKQTPPDRFACHLQALAEPPLSDLMLLTLREHFDAGSRIGHGGVVTRVPMSQRGDGQPLPPAFLDLEQEGLAKLDVKLPPQAERWVRRMDTRLVTGPAGSGKSLVLLHRALFAARLNRRSRLLILTHNRPINGELRRRAMATAPEGVRIEWLTFFQWAMRCLPQRPVRVLSQREVEQRIRGLMEGRFGRITVGFVVEELGYLRDLGVGSLQEYLDLERIGRLMGLSVARRKDIWGVLERYRSELDGRREADWHEVALAFRDFSSRHPEQLQQYDFIFIDEAQFFAKVWFEPVRAALRPGGQLFLAADPTQGFLKRRESWLAAGIDVRGRSNRLSTPYRSTRAIMRFARNLLRVRAPLHAELVQDLDPPSEQDLALTMEDGESPILLDVPSAHDAIIRVTRELVQLVADAPQLRGQVLLLHADSHAKAGLVAALRAKLGGHEVLDLNSTDKQPTGAYCAVTNCKAATGLEAAVVFLLGVDSLIGKEQDPRLDVSARAEMAADHTRLLYMACTRAASRLIILSKHWPQ